MTSTAPPAPPPINPFAEAVPFAEATSPYESMEEVSLDQLLAEGRERPATLHGNVPVPVPIEEIEELGQEELVEEAPVAVEVEEEAPPPAAAEAAPDTAHLEIRVRELEQQIESMRAEHRAEIERILAQLGELSGSIRSRL